jgi:hypothetical protein
LYRVRIRLRHHLQEVDAQQVLPGFVQETTERAVDERQPAGAVKAADVLGLVLDHSPIALLARPQGLLGTLLLGDVENIAVE